MSKRRGVYIFFRMSSNNVLFMCILKEGRGENFTPVIFFCRRDGGVQENEKFRAEVNACLIFCVAYARRKGQKEI